MFDQMRRLACAAGLRALSTLALSAGLAACGGGGGSDDGAWLRFTPAELAATTYEGESVAVQVAATSSRTISETLYVGIVDPAGVLTPEISIAADGMTFVTTIHVSPALGTGTYAGNLSVRLCRDDPTTCASPYPGSPWQLPYRFQVLPGTNLTALSPLAGAAAWTTHQGNAAHTGHVPATLSAPQFSRRWGWPQAASAVTAEGGRVFTVTGGPGERWKLTALRESDGSTAWEYDMGLLYRVNAPAVSGGRVYVTSTGHSDTFMWVFDAASGMLRAKRPMQSQWDQYLAPTVHNGAVYTNSGGYGGLAKFDTATVTEQWWVGLRQFDGWTPAVDDQYAYSLAGETFTATDVRDGSSAFWIYDTGFDWRGYTMYGAPVLDGAGRAFASSMGGRLLGFSLTDRSLAWSVTDQIQGDPALAGGVLYVVNGSRLEARSPADGALQWTWTIPDGALLQYPQRAQVVVTGNLAFVTGASHTYAVDLATRTSPWNYPAAGPLAISPNGILYIAAWDGKLVAVNLH